MICPTAQAKWLRQINATGKLRGAGQRKAYLNPVEKVQLQPNAELLFFGRRRKPAIS
jgi:hypothetical protein